MVGDLRKVPIEEVSIRSYSCGSPLIFILVQNLRDEVAMDMDDDENGTQRPRNVPDYGIEVDFEELDDEEREVGVNWISFMPRRI